MPSGSFGMPLVCDIVYSGMELPVPHEGGHSHEVFVALRCEFDCRWHVDCTAHVRPEAASVSGLFHSQEGKLVMSRLAIAFVLAVAATAANAQDTKSGQSDTPAVASANGTRPFLFDGRMRGDGDQQGAHADDHYPNAGAIVVPPKASQPGRER